MSLKTGREQKGPPFPCGHKAVNPAKPWQMKRHRTRWYKHCMNRTERRRAKADPECAPTYRVFRGWEW